VKPRFLAAALITLLSPGCDESLPPRGDPQDYLAISMTATPGTVLLREDLSMFSEMPGAFTVGLTNLHDEVLQSTEDISIDITISVQGSSSHGGTTHGDRNQLLTFWMMQNQDQLTIEPDSTAIFFIQWDHADLRVWESAGLTFHRQPGNPVDITWFESGPVTIIGNGTARFFKDVAPLTLPESRAVIDYRIFVPDPVPTRIDSFEARYDATIPGVRLTWLTPFESQNYGFKLEKGMSMDAFPYLYEDGIPGQGTIFDTTYYAYIDSLNIQPGQWYYRLQRWYDFGFTLLQLDPSQPVSLVIP